MLLHSQGYKDLLLKINSNSGQTVNLGILQLEDNFSDEVPAALITLLDSDLSDDNSSSEMTSGLLQSSKDAFMQASAFNWGQARFRVRGLDSENGTMMLNGMVMNKIYDGRPQWNNWGGLNDVLRNQEFSVGAAASNLYFWRNFGYAANIRPALRLTEKEQGLLFQEVIPLITGVPMVLMLPE